MGEEMPPFEVFERIVDHALEEYVEPKLKALRSENRQLKKLLDIAKEELASQRETLRQEFRTELEVIRRGYQNAIDRLTSKVAELSVVERSTRCHLAVDMMKCSLLQVHEAQSVSASVKALLVEKYDQATDEVLKANDPIDVATHFHRLCIDAGHQAGMRTLKEAHRTTA